MDEFDSHHIFNQLPASHWSHVKSKLVSDKGRLKFADKKEFSDISCKSSEVVFPVQTRCNVTNVNFPWFGRWGLPKPSSQEYNSKQIGSGRMYGSKIFESVEILCKITKGNQSTPLELIMNGLKIDEWQESVSNSSGSSDLKLPDCS